MINFQPDNSLPHSFRLKKQVNMISNGNVLVPGSHFMFHNRTINRLAACPNAPFDTGMGTSKVYYDNCQTVAANAINPFRRKYYLKNLIILLCRIFNLAGYYGTGKSTTSFTVLPEMLK